MQISFLGGADEVGASSTLVQIGERRLLIDAGIRISPKSCQGLVGDQLPDFSTLDQAGGPDAILLTHAHTDHSGVLALVVERYNCPVFTTSMTIALVRILQADARHIMKIRLEQEGELPLLDDVAVTKLMAAFKPVPFNTRFSPAAGIFATFFPAGHIAGAAMIGLETEDGQVLFSGDISVTPQRIVGGAKIPAFKPDLLILESTYGRRLHANRAAEERRLLETITKIVEQEGKVLIPAFALGRAQEIISTLRDAIKRGQLPGVTVWVDGMVRAICAEYSRFAEPERNGLRESKPVFFNGSIKAIRHPAKRMGLLRQPGPLVIVSSSGMLSGGPSAYYAAALAGYPQHAILLTGYQDEEAPGRRLQDVARRGRGMLRLNGKKIDVQCQIGTYSLSAHADQSELISLAETLSPTDVVLVHGDKAARENLCAGLVERGRRVHLPFTGQTLEFQYELSLAQKIARRQREAGGIGDGQPLDLAKLWEVMADPVRGGQFSDVELIRIWWGDETDHEQALAAAVREDNPYFVPVGNGKYKAYTRKQSQRSIRRRELMEKLCLESGQVLIIRNSKKPAFLVRCIEVHADRFSIAANPAPYWPEHVLRVLVDAAPVDFAAIEAQAAALAPAQLITPGDAPRPVAAMMSAAALQDSAEMRIAVELALLRAGAKYTPDGYILKSRPRKPMEYNQVLAFVRTQFPPAARLRKCGYRREQQVVTLTFDFPDAAHCRFAEVIERLPAFTGWQFESNVLPHQEALLDLARASLPIVKTPALHQDRKCVTVAVEKQVENAAQICTQFKETTGFELEIVIADAPPASIIAPVATPRMRGQAMEINAAYALLKAQLTGSTLYRTSNKGNVIELSFISPQIGERYNLKIAALSQATGWPLSINPQPNQGKILTVVRDVLSQSECQVAKGPGLHVAQGMVQVRLKVPLEAELRERVETAVEKQTGYRLSIKI